MCRSSPLPAHATLEKKTSSNEEYPQRKIIDSYDESPHPNKDLPSLLHVKNIHLVAWRLSWVASGMDGIGQVMLH